MLTLALGALAILPAAGTAYQTGIGDEQSAMFHSPYFRALHTKIARYITPYDVADSSVDRYYADAWIRAAEAQHIQPLIAFYHSRQTATRMPSKAAYLREVKRFMVLHPEIHNYEPWNESNRGNVRESGGGSFHSPSAHQAADYYLALRGACRHCTVVGLDVLDSQNVSATVRYIQQFKRYVRGKTPTVWGLHNYTDTNRFRTTGTRAVLAAIPGTLWLTETGGIVKFGRAFPTSTSRAARALKYMFRLARSNRRITRLYIFNWTGGPSSQRFDAGLTDTKGKPRPGYFVVRKQLTHH